MIEVLPIGVDGICRAAERLIAENGPEARIEAERLAGVFRTDGLEPLAQLWDLISEVIQDLDDPMVRRRSHEEVCRELGLPID